LPVDKWGHPFFYPTKVTAGLSGTGHGFFWEQNNDVRKDDDYTGTAMLRIGKEHDLSTYKVIDTTTGEWTFPFNFSGSDGLSLSGPTGHHSGGVTHGCQGFTYMINVSLEDNPPVFRFRKETYHVQYDNDPVTGTWTHPFAPTKIVGGGWFGYGWVAYNKKDGRGPGKDSRIIEAWWNPTPETNKNNWQMLKRREDKGTEWGVAATCGGAAHQVGTWSNIQFRFKVDASDFSLHPLKPEPDSGPNITSIGGESMNFADCERRGYGYRVDMPRDIEMKCVFKFPDTSGVAHFKNISLREIDPSLSFTDTSPPTPDPTPTGGGTLIGNFKYQWDINQLRTNPCAGIGTGSGGTTGGGDPEPGNTKFYSVYTDDGIDSDKELSDSSTFQNRTRIAMQVANSSSDFHGKKPNQVDIPLKKVGSPGASQPVFAKIYNGSGSIIYESPTTFDPSTFSTSYVKKIFDFSTNTHTLVTGDWIGVKYSGTSDTNYVAVSYGGTAYPNTNYGQYENGVWDIKTRRLTMDVWE
jgi:hypothetical protein